MIVEKVSDTNEFGVHPIVVVECCVETMTEPEAPAHPEAITTWHPMLVALLEA